MQRRGKKFLINILEKELLIILAVVVLLGILIGYSLAAARNDQKYQMSTPFQNSSVILRGELGDEEIN